MSPTAGWVAAFLIPSCFCDWRHLAIFVARSWCDDCCMFCRFCPHLVCGFYVGFSQRVKGQDHQADVHDQRNQHRLDCAAQMKQQLFPLILMIPLQLFSTNLGIKKNKSQLIQCASETLAHHFRFFGWWTLNLGSLMVPPPTYTLPIPSIHSGK